MFPSNSLLNDVLGRVGEFATVSRKDYDGTGEWIRLESKKLDNDDLFATLRDNWSDIIGAIHHFALIHCHTGDNAGVWLDYLGTPELRAEYLRGCHQIPSWK